MNDLVPNKLVKAGDIVFSEGDYPDSGIFYICYGDVEITRNEFGKSRSLAKLGPGGVFGEMAIINSEPRNATVTALTDCGFFTVNQENFQHKVKQLDPMMRGTFRSFVLTIRDFIQQREQWTGHLQSMMQELKEQDPTTPHEEGRLADGIARKMHY